MSDSVFQKVTNDRIERIHSLSVELNQKQGHDHTQKLFEMIQHHAQEIKELYATGDRHFIVETGDLAVLCLELIIEHKESIDETMLTCLERFEKKLSMLLSEENEKRT